MWNSSIKCKLLDGQMLTKRFYISPLFRSFSIWNKNHLTLEGDSKKTIMIFNRYLFELPLYMLPFPNNLLRRYRHISKYNFCIVFPTTFEYRNERYLSSVTDVFHSLQSNIVSYICDIQ